MEPIAPELVHKWNAGNVLISALRLEEGKPGSPLISCAQESHFEADLIVDSAHSFFFEHPNDHIPGLFLVEAARQFAVASAHVFGNVPLQGVRFCISKLDMDFSSYLELDLPVVLLGWTRTRSFSSQGYWNEIQFECGFVQCDKIAVRTTIVGKAIPESIYGRIRRKKMRA